MNKNTSASDCFTKLVEIIAALRHPERGCPWDLKQTHQSLKPYAIEETYELIDAIDSENSIKIREELGDVLLQVVLHSQIASDSKHFDIADVVADLCDKLITRHPHVFGDVKAANSDEAVKSWETAKNNSVNSGILDGIARSLPALQKAQRIGARVGRVGFDWNDTPEIQEKLREELRELAECDLTKDRIKFEEELGDTLFTLVQLGRRLDLNCEEILQRACQKFTRRFQEMERLSDRKLHSLNKVELEGLWERSKKAD